MESFSRRYKAISNSYRLDLAQFLAATATRAETVTYGRVAEQFGGTARGWGRPLSAIAIRCRDAGFPLLSVLVVSATTGMPSVDAALYAELGLVSPDDLAAEQRRCFEFDWRATPLLREPV